MRLEKRKITLLSLETIRANRNPRFEALDGELDKSERSEDVLCNMGGKLSYILYVDLYEYGLFYITYDWKNIKY